MSGLLLLVLQLLSLLPQRPVVVDGCYIQGSDTGECSALTLNLKWKEANMPYCAKRVKYPACIPKYQKIPPSREFPQGRWFNHTVTTKDQWVRDSAEGHIRHRIKLEMNKSLRARGEDEYGDPVIIRKRFRKQTDCRNAFRNLFCWANFPRCDMTLKESLAMCRSACENYFITCGFVKEMWRCGDPRYFDGYEPEAPTKVAGNDTYLRDYFPGSPWRENKYNKHKSEVPICTPALDGAASRAGDVLASITIAIFVTLVLYL